MERFRVKLRMARELKKISAAEVAKRVQLNRTFIYDLETGRKNPSLETVIKLSEVYEDPTIVQDFMRANGISDVQIDVSLSADKQRVFEELSRLDDGSKIGKKLYEIIRSDDAALTEWTQIVYGFITKHTKPNENDSE